MKLFENENCAGEMLFFKLGKFKKKCLKRMLLFSPELTRKSIMLSGFLQQTGLPKVIL